MGVAPLVWEEIISWANRFYKQDKIVMIPKTTVKTTEKIVRGKSKIETETVVEEVPVVIPSSALEDYELEIIMQLSREYCNEYSESSDPQRPCPKEIFLDEVDASQNADDMLAAFKLQFGQASQSSKPEIVSNR